MIYRGLKESHALKVINGRYVLRSPAVLICLQKYDDTAVKWSWASSCWNPDAYCGNSFKNGSSFFL